MTAPATSTAEEHTVIRFELPNVATADRLVEALYVAAGRHPDTAQAREWLTLATDLETGIDQLPPQHPFGDQHSTRTTP